MSNDAVITWRDDRNVVIDDVPFELGADPTPASSPDHLRVLKPRWMVEEYLRLTGRERPRRILELGLYDGGSTALLALAARPERLIGVELAAAAPALDRWLAASTAPARHAVRPYYGVDQADRARLNAILDAELGGAPLDIAIDDASHLLEPSIASFEVVFPRLRTGGVFVLEDWASVHDIERVLMEHPERLTLRPDAITEPPTPLTRMVFEVILAIAYTEIVAEVRIARHWAEIRRGPASVEAATFALRNCYGPRGAELLRDPKTVGAKW
jgi:hypothetical protein